MVGDQLSKRQDRALHRAFESVVLTQFPNPERKDCPGTGTLRAIANKRIPMRDPALAHVGQCSPCLAELTEMRQATRQTNLIWIAASATVAAILLLVLVGPSVLWRNHSIPASPQAQRIAAVLDLRNASASRTAQPPQPNQPRIEIPRGLLTMTLVLPIGSDPGTYDVEIRKQNQSSTAAVQGLAAIENGVTILQLSIDTRTHEVGDYEIAWRQPQFDWRSHPIFIK
jgi:hypothetical protein